MDRATPYFPPNYVTLKHLHDQRLKEKHDAEEAERQRRKLEEEAEQARKLEEEEQARKLDQQKQDEERLRTRRLKKPSPRKHAAVIIAEGNPEDSAAAVEPKKGNKNKKGKAARNGQNSLVAAVAEGFGDLTVDGAEENAAVAVTGRGRGGNGRGRNRRTEGSTRLCWRAVECGIKPNVMTTTVQELGVEAEGNVESGGVLDQVAAVGEEPKGNAVDRKLEVAEDVAVTGDNGACVDGKAVVAGRGRPRRWARRRVKTGSRPIDPSEPNQAIEDNETQEEGNVLEVEKGMKRTVGRGRGRNSGFRGSFSETAGSRSSDGMVWVRKTVS